MRTDIKKCTYGMLFVILACGLFYVLFKYLFPIVAPFALASLIAIFLSPVIVWVSKLTHLPRRACGLVILFLCFSGLGVILFFMSKLLLSGLLRLLSELPYMAELFWSELCDAISCSPLGEVLGELPDTKWVLSVFMNFAEGLVSDLPDAVMALPNGVMFCATFGIACFYICVDMESIDRVILYFFPKASPAEARKKLRTIVIGYGKAYAIILSVTFAEVLIGLSIMRVPNSMLLAIIIAIVDILPILGVGTALIPWSIFCFLTSNARLGIGLLVLYIITVIVRQFLEGKILGSHIGVHPLLMLASIYICVKLFGVRGVLVGMAIAFAFTEFIKRGKTIYKFPVDKKEL